MLAYAVLGGIPHYLNQFRPELSVQENIKRNILTKGSVLYSEVDFLLAVLQFHVPEILQNGRNAFVPFAHIGELVDYNELLFFSVWEIQDRPESLFPIREF